MDLGKILALTARKFPHRIALICGEERVTYQAYEDRVHRLAHGLLRIGLRKGDRVAVLLYNSIPMVEIFFACASTGGVFTPINFRFTAEEVFYILDHSDARFFIYGQEFSELVETIRPRLERIEFFLAVGESSSARTLDYETLLREASSEAPEVQLTERDECELMYTSGTTGRPKGALLTHGNLLWNLFNTILGREEREGERSIVISPLYHTAGLNNHFLTRVAMAGTSILVKQFDPERVMEIIEEERATVISGAPAAYHFMLSLPEGRYDTRSITKCTTGASILPTETKERLVKLFPNLTGIYDVYGCTEASPSIAILKAGESMKKERCVGRAVPFLEVRIVDEQDRDLPFGEVGEVVCRGPNVTKGYYKDEEATREALRGGWLHTGDLARMDEEGFLYIVGRKKEMIVSGGENIYPREIEEVLFRHPKIEEAAVIGVPDPLWGESVRAFVVLKRGEVMTEAEVIQYCKRHLASYKKPKSVEFVEALPRNPSGKVLKRILKEDYLKRVGAGDPSLGE
ncbi:MAG: long-chain-fatty-acid--CoA ligase [Desulfobacterota bacterium]|nr:long-chain-fatty-acid--CoA ligase [Thermodesulfobacteriota bacterium]